MNKGEDLVRGMSRDDVLNRFLMVSLLINIYLTLYHRLYKTDNL